MMMNLNEKTYRERLTAISDAFLRKCFETTRLHRKVSRLWTAVCILSGLLLAAVCALWVPSL